MNMEIKKCVETLKNDLQHKRKSLNTKNILKMTIVLSKMKLIYLWQIKLTWRTYRWSYHSENKLKFYTEENDRDY